MSTTICSTRRPPIPPEALISAAARAEPLTISRPSWRAGPCSGKAEPISSGRRAQRRRGGSRRWLAGGRRCRARLRPGVEVPDRDALGQGAARPAPAGEGTRGPPPPPPRPPGWPGRACRGRARRAWTRSGCWCAACPRFLIAEAAGHEGEDVELPRRQASGQRHRRDGDEDGLPCESGGARSRSTRTHRPGSAARRSGPGGRGLGVGPGVVNQPRGWPRGRRPRPAAGVPPWSRLGRRRPRAGEPGAVQRPRPARRFAHRPGSAGSTPVFCLAHIVEPARPGKSVIGWICADCNPEQEPDQSAARSPVGPARADPRAGDGAFAGC